MIGERVRLAREACELTQAELCEAASLAQSTLSNIEAGRVLQPCADTVAAIAQVTGYPLSFFYRGPLPDMPEGNYRRLARGTAKTDKRVRAQTRQLVEIVQQSELMLALPQVALAPVRDLTDVDEIERVVIRVREAFQVGLRDPIPNLTRAVERSGVAVARLPGAIPDHDSYSAWPDFGVGGRPIIVLTGGHPGDRDRFNTAHELGHLVLHSERRGVDHKQAEIEAHRFAGALLLPKPAATQRMPAPITLRVLMGVKATYGISMAAAARRARDLGLISHAHYVSLQKQLSARGWRKEEPVEVPREQPVLIPKILAALGGGGPMPQQAERLGLPVFILHAFVSSC